MMAEVEIFLTPQARAVISQSNASEGEVLEWFGKRRRISIGGGDVILFLEKRSRGEI